MLYPTLLEIIQKVEKDLDLEAETFITKSEMTGYVNEAVDEAEAEILGLYEDYFVTRVPLTLVKDQEEYDLPADIYAHKIRRLIFRNGSEVYRMTRLRDWYKFENYEVEQVNKSSTIYAWFLVNSVAGSPKILISPPSKVDGAFVKVWYLRNANRLSADTDKCDIPEFVNFIYQYVKVRCYEKEMHPALEKAMQDLETQRQSMVSTLSTMVPDAENTIEADLTHYDEMS